MLARARRAVIRHIPEPILLRVARWRQQPERVLAALGAPGAATTSGALPRGVRARVVHEFDAHALWRETTGTVTDALAAQHIPYALVPEITGRRVRVAVASEQRQGVLAALRAALTGAEWTIRAGVAAAVHAPVLAASRSDSWLVYPEIAAANGAWLAGPELGCRVEFWTAVTEQGTPRADGGHHPVGTRLAPEPRAIVTAYLDPDVWARETSPERRLATTPSIFQVREPIDIVYTWVDGADRGWLERRARFDGEASGSEQSAAHESRYLSRDELRYSLRSVAMYASWVRQIFVVTDRQVPPWLNTEHPQLRIVDHSEIFTDQSVLPVFNSHAIESQLHHIAGLAEHYVYFNDDVFLGRPVDPELFFHGNGLAKFFLSPRTVDPADVRAADIPLVSAAKRNRDLLREQFDVTVAARFQHTPHPQLREVLEAMEAAHADVFAAVARSRFRDSDDVSIASSLAHYYAYALGRAVPGEIAYAFQDIGRPDTERRLDALLRDRSVDVFCLNDHESDEPARVRQQRLLPAFLERYFPVPSPYERARG